MNFPARTGAHPPAPDQTSANGFEHEWLSVDLAVTYCASLGLKRTPKTVRKWAERSSGLPDGDVVSRKQDTLWGYRWQIEKASLTRKVEEELQLQAANDTEPVRTGSDEQLHALTEKPLLQNETVTSNPPAPVQTSSDMFEQSEPETAKTSQPEPGSHPPAPVQTGSEIALVLSEVRERLSDKNKEIAFLREQLSEAQAEIGRRAASTDDALKSIDRVVKGFVAQAEANRAAELRAGRAETPEPPQTVYVQTETRDNPQGDQDIRRV